MAIATAVLGVKIVANGKTFVVHEGDIVHDLKYHWGSTEHTITGVVRVINAATTSYNSGNTECPPEPYAYKYINAYSLIIDCSTEMDAELITVNMYEIDDIGTVETEPGVITVGVGDQYKALSEVIATADVNSVIKLTAGEYTETLNVSKSLYLEGEPGAKLTGKMVFDSGLARTGEEVHITLKNLELTGDCLLEIGNVASFNMEGCTFANHNITVARTYPVYFKSAVEMMVCIDNCTFGTQNSNSYNLIECNAILTDGSSFCGNTFAIDACTHNQISMYGVVNGATISVNNNTFGYGNGGVRIGFKGAPECVVYVNGNVLETISDDGWGGMVTIQPYGTATTTFAGLTVYASGNTMPEDHEGNIVYQYNGSKDTQIVGELCPIVYLNGERLDPIPVVL